MEEKVKQELARNEGYVFFLSDYEVRLGWKAGSVITAAFFKRPRDDFDNHQPFTEDEVQQLIEDLKDLSDWRHYRRLKNKLNQ
ncbi:hypothetical protein JXA12_04360 [Candidatus Woesearchaeota archaeon]|nr:hypothetical protein [Candidatus Woesearchaeota archaeon]